MDRLTRRLVDGRADCAYCDGEFDNEGNCKNNCELRAKQLERLAELEEVEEQGRLVMLPCKAGQRKKPVAVPVCTRNLETCADCSDNDNCRNTRM